jgi:hypothetical protein
MKIEKEAYQTLKNKLFSSLCEDSDSLFYYLTQKKIHQKETRKRSIIDILNAIGAKASFFDIVSFLISKRDVDSLTELILGEKASSSKKAIICGFDCCLVCKKDTACQKALTPLTHPDKVNYLLYLRYVESKKLLRMLKWGLNASCFTILLKEPILMKFIANYALVVDIKNELKKEGKIKDHKTLYKGMGRYCPMDDFWETAGG